MSHGWYAFDLDGTLARHESGQGIRTIGEPIAGMVCLAKGLIDRGEEVRIFTARACGADGPDAHEYQINIIEDWCLKHLGKRVPITATKDYSMIELYDDRAVGVTKNTGITDREELDRATDTIDALKAELEDVHTEYESYRNMCG